MGLYWLYNFKQCYKKKKAKHQILESKKIITKYFTKTEKIKIKVNINESVSKTKIIELINQGASSLKRLTKQTSLSGKFEIE